MQTEKEKLTFASGDNGHTAPRGAQFGLRSLMLVTAGACVLFGVLKAAGATVLQACLGLAVIGLFCVVLIACIEIVSLFRRKDDWQGRDPYYGCRPSMWARWSGRYVGPDEAPRRSTAIDFSAVPDENIEWIGDVHGAVDSRETKAIPLPPDESEGQGIDWSESNGGERRDEPAPDEPFGVALRDDPRTL